LSRPHDLEDAERLQQLEERVHLLFRARDLDDVGLARDVDDLRAEDVDEVGELAAGLLVGAHLDEHELALDVLRLREVADLDHADELVQLLLHLLENLVVAARDERDAGHRRTDRLSMLKPRPLNSPATRASTPNSFSTRIEMMWRISVRSVASEDFHDLVLAGELELLQPLLLHLFVGRQVELLLENVQLALEV